MNTTCNVAILEKRMNTINRGIDAVGCCRRWEKLEEKDPLDLLTCSHPHSLIQSSPKRVVITFRVNLNKIHPNFILLHFTFIFWPEDEWKWTTRERKMGWESSGFLRGFFECTSEELNIQPAQKDPFFFLFSSLSRILFSMISIYLDSSASHGLGPRTFSQSSMFKFSFISRYSWWMSTSSSKSNPFAFQLFLCQLLKYAQKTWNVGGMKLVQGRRWFTNDDDTLTPHVLLWADTSYRTDVNWDKR